MEKGSSIRRIVKISSDHGKEFENYEFKSFCENMGIQHEFSTPKTPKKNGIIEQNNNAIQ